MANDFGQLDAYETKTALFRGNMLSVTLCAKGNYANCKKHEKTKQKWKHKGCWVDRGWDM